MSTVGPFLAERTGKVAGQLIAAFDRLPSDKQTWTPAETSRSALDQLAECAVLNGYTATTIRNQQWGKMEMSDYFAAKAGLVAEGADAAKAKLLANVEDLKLALAAFSDGDLDKQIETSFGPMQMKDILEYPFWNMSYHEGQINYIASIHGLL